MVRALYARWLQAVSGQAFWRSAVGMSVVLLGAWGISSESSAAEPAAAAAEQSPGPAIKVLIVDGQNNHDWKSTTPVLQQALKDAGLFAVDVATTPPGGADLSAFRPAFEDYDVVLSNYNGDLWPAETRLAFERFVRSGGGFVCVHAANNSFPDWPEYNRMIGLGGWGGRNEKAGPYVYLENDQVVRNPAPGSGGSHGPQHEFEVVIRDSKHPITQDMPKSWLHTQDELYDSLRGPAESMEILATAYSAKSGRHEPMIMTIEYGQGRVFHTPMGHADYSMKCAGFVTTVQRGTEWAATGKVTLPLSGKFPTAKASSSQY